jgi:formyltetrahydrofolate deformylase
MTTRDRARLLIDCPDGPVARRLGADVERVVLARAVQWHLADRVIAHHGSTVVF